MKTINQKRQAKYEELMKLSGTEIDALYSKAWKAEDVSNKYYTHATDFKLHHYEHAIACIVPAIIFGITMIKCVDKVCDTVSTIKDEANYVHHTKTSYKPKAKQRYDLAERVDDIYFEDKLDGEAVLDALTSSIKVNGYATVADLLKACGFATDNNIDSLYGWTNISKACVDKSENGWKLNMPKPRNLGSQ